MSARPRRWLFSGWNCVPATLSRATRAVTGPPYSACGHDVVRALGRQRVAVHEIGVQPVLAGAGCRRAAAWSRAARRVFQPICGILSDGSDGPDRPDIAGDPAEPRRGRCIPGRGSPGAACPRRSRGRGARPHARRCVIASTMPGTASRPAAAIRVGADARQHDAVGGATASGSTVRRSASSRPLSRAARSKALAAEWRLPDP